MNKYSLYLFDFIVIMVMQLLVSILELIFYLRKKKMLPVK